MMSPSTEPLSRMSTFSEAVTLPVTSPSTMTALANTSARILPLGPIVRMLSLQLDPTLDVALDGQIFAAAQLALDDDRLPDIHLVPLKSECAARSMRAALSTPRVPPAPPARVPVAGPA